MGWRKKSQPWKTQEKKSRFSIYFKIETLHLQEPYVDWVKAVLIFLKLNFIILLRVHVGLIKTDSSLFWLVAKLATICKYECNMYYRGSAQVDWFIFVISLCLKSMCLKAMLSIICSNYLIFMNLWILT